MGQYYMPVILDSKKKKPLGYACSHDFGNGLKLMEHSYIGNEFVSFIESLLIGTPKNLVWAGDYADGEAQKDVPKSILNKIVKEIKSDDCSDEDKKRYLNNLVSDGVNFYTMADHTPKLKPTSAKLITIGRNKHNFLVNHNKKEFVDKSKLKEIKDWKGVSIHPLPLLTCEGNGRGGGDFRGENKLIGTWARDSISVETKQPVGFKEIVPNFKES